jgi:glycine cleavage system aminomethyltransferase T
MPDTVSPLARTPLHHWHADRGARFTVRDGWQVVAAYAGVEPELGAARAGVGLADVSAFARIGPRGPATPSLSACVTDEPVRPDGTASYAGFAAVGPRLEGLLQRLTHLDVRPAALPANSCVETALAGVEALLVRPGGRSLPALWVFVPWDLGEYVWERMMEAGRDLSIVPIGLEALRSL